MTAHKREADKAYAIVVGLDCIQGLQSARILASRGAPVIAIAKNRHYYSTRTRVCEEILFADTGGEGLVECLEELGSALKQKAVLFPCQDKNVHVISKFRERLEPWYHIILPKHDTVEMMMDKASFYKYAQEKGFPIPPTFIMRFRDEAEKAAEAIPYPCIIKPNYRLRTWSKHTKLKGVIASNPQEFLAHYDRHSPWADALIAQELIQGGDRNHYTCNCYFTRQGEPVATFTSRKLRQWQPKTGQACLSEEVRDDVVLRETVRVYCSVEHQGLGYLEMKRDERSGEYFIIEPNIGRPTGRAAMAEAAGVELLMTMYCDALSLPLPDAREQTYRGVKWIHLLRDLQAALYHLARRELTLREWWLSVRGPKTYAIFSWRDPVPFLASIFRALPTLLSAKERGGIEDEDQ